MALRKIRTDGDPILRKQSRKVQVINDRIKTLLEDMLETMYDANGVGLAAPQVGILRRIIVVDIGQGPIKMINPVLKNEEGETYMQEGCLSIPGFTGYVKRPAKLTVEYQDEKGDERTFTAEGFLARALCHEVDHLNGILFKDIVVPDEEVPEEFLSKEGGEE